MKRKNEKAPGFDEIIFENRNKNYGAYDLRKRYNSATSLSILGGVAFFSLLMIALSFSTEEGTASTGLKTVIIEISDPIIQEKITPPELKPPPEPSDVTRYLEPVVVTDTSQITSYIPITDELIETTEDGEITMDVKVIVNPDPVIIPEPEPFIVVEESPEYPGGTTALLKFIGENIRYPAEALNNNIQGRVILKFVVNTDGSADRIEILRGVDPLLDNEAVRVVSTITGFKPGKQGGMPVPVWFTLPVIFILEDY